MDITRREYSEDGLIVKQAVFTLDDAARNDLHRALFVNDTLTVSAAMTFLCREAWERCDARDKQLLLCDLNRWREGVKRAEFEAVQAEHEAAHVRREARDPEKEKYKQRYREKVSQKVSRLLTPPKQGELEKENI